MRARGRSRESGLRRGRSGRSVYVVASLSEARAWRSREEGTRRWPWSAASAFSLLAMTIVRTHLGGAGERVEETGVSARLA
jgi:hypothetical protein